MPIKVLIRAIKQLLKEGVLSESCPINPETLDLIFKRAKEMELH